MKGINYVTNSKGEKIALMIDLLNHDQALKEYLEDLMDLIDIELRKKEETVPWKKAGKELKDKGIIE